MPPNHLTPAWDADEDATVSAAFENGATEAEIAALMPNRTRAAVKNRIQLLRKKGLRRLRATHHCQPVAMPTVRSVGEYRAPDGPSLAETFAPEDSADEPDDVFLERMLTGATRSIAKAKAQRHARLRIAASGPVAISLSSDWHVSRKNTDLRGLLEYAEYAAATPDLYCLGVGDMFDNPIKHRGSDVGGVKDELRFLDLLVGRFRGKLLGMTSGNHDDWSKVFGGVDQLMALARRHRIHYAPDELLWQVELVDPTDPDTVTATYHIMTRHQWRRGSTLNPGHACWTWWQEEGPNWSVRPDVLAIGHNHAALVESRQYADMPDVWALRMGAWQVESDFSRAKGFGRYRSTAPTVVLHPHRDRPVQAFADPTEAVAYMDGARRARAA